MRVAVDVPGERLFDYTVPPLQASPPRGARVRVPWGKDGVAIGIVVAYAPDTDVPPDRLKPFDAVLNDLPPLPDEWLALADFASRYYQRGLAETLLQGLPEPLKAVDRYRQAPDGAWVSIPIERALRALGRLPPPERRRAKRQTTLTNPHASAVSAVDPAASATAALPLNAQQRAALAAFDALLATPHPVPLLLHGVTGAGKTEVYLCAIERLMAAGKQALLLVPEINLTPQLEARVRARFPTHRIAVLHSGIAESERTLSWIAAMHGDADIVLGTRLAIFTPMPRLGAILVDEEHDASYKQQEGIRYSARDLAVWRARQRAIPVMLGSATPALETWANAQQGRYGVATLSARARAGARLPEIVLVDERVDRPVEGLTQRVREALCDTLAAAAQSIVYLNRRGYAPVLACGACGWVAGCAHCTGHAVYHKADRRLHCHHCGAQARVPQRCPTCGNQDLAPLGRGTQRVEETLRALLPQARIARIDADATRRKGTAQALFDAVHGGLVDVLVGTQMLAKGHDFARVTTVAVIGADAALYSHDFRAPERLFQQLMQVAGRSGRADRAGRVLIQTRYPDHPLYSALLTHDYARYAQALLDERRDAHLPPYTHQAILRAQARDMETALGFLTQALVQARALPQVDEVRLYDPVPMALSRVANQERAQLLVESPRRAALQAFLPAWAQALGGRTAGRQGALKWHLEVDPLDI